MLAAELSTLQKCTSCQLRLKENLRKETLWSKDLLRNSTVDPDQSQEQLNRIGKRGGGIVGITQMPTALGRWALSFNLRSHIAAETKELYHLGYADDINYNEGSASRQKKDTAHKDALYSSLQRFVVFSPSTNEALQNILTKTLQHIRLIAPWFKHILFHLT